MENKLEPIIINKFFINSENEINTKSLMKYFRKKRVLGHFDVSKKIQNSFFEFREYLKNYYNTEIKKQGINDLTNISVLSKDKMYSLHLGIMFDNIKINHNPIKTPPPPNCNWDILCYHSDIKNYYYDYEFNNQFWTKTDINNSLNFVINFKSIPLIIDILNKTVSYVDFYKELTNLNVFSLNQYVFVEPKEKDNVNLKTINYKTQKKNKQEYYNILFNNINEKLFDIPINEESSINLERKEKLLESVDDKLKPRITLICPLIDHNTFWNNVLLFNKIKYEREKLEFIIFDHLNIDIKIKNFIKNDKRFKLIKLNNNNLENLRKKQKESELEWKQNEKQIPLGFMLNNMIKFATGDIIIPFFNYTHYYINNFNKLIALLMSSNIECLISSRLQFLDMKKSEFALKKLTLSENKLQESAHKLQTQLQLQTQSGQESAQGEFELINSLLFTKNFWKTYSFDELENNEYMLIYNFIKYRKSLVNYYDIKWRINLQFQKEQNFGGRLFKECFSEDLKEYLETFHILKANNK
jgi:hypothetical protein